MRRLALAAAALAVAGALVAGVVIARDGHGTAVAGGTGEPAPELSGTDPVTGKPVALSDFAGKPVVVNVWASWCPPCAAEAPDLKQFAERHPEVQLIGVDILDTSGGARAFYERFGWTHPSIADPDGELAAALGLPGQPNTYFLNERHEIVERIVGASDLEGFEAALERAASA